MSQRNTNWFRLEAEGGWREILSGKIGATTAWFGSGDAFTRLPDQGTNGWFGRLRAIGGSSDYQIGGELGLENTNERVGFALRGTLRLPF